MSCRAQVSYDSSRTCIQRPLHLDIDLGCLYLVLVRNLEDVSLDT